MNRIQMLISGLGCASFFILSNLSAYPGEAYQATFKSVMIARDLTDEEIDNAHNMPGRGYLDGSDAVKEAPHVATNVFQDDDGTVIIVDDNGDIHFV